MRLMLAGAIVGAVVTVAAPAGAQAAGGAPKFSGIKLVDMKARTPEQTVNVVVHSSSLKIENPSDNSAIKTLDYSGLQVVHTFSSTPPKSAGDPSAAATQPGSLPMYMGRDPRNWLTFTAGDEHVTLRVSAKVYAQLKEAIESHGVTLAEEK